MSKIGQAFGSKGSGKISKREIFEALFQKKQEEDRLALLGIPGINKDASLAKFDQARRKKSSRLKRGPGGSIADDDDAIVRPGARKATLLGQ